MTNNTEIESQHIQSDEALLIEQDGEWLTLWFNRPKVRNALVRDLFDQLIQALDMLKTKKSFRGVVFRGMGGFFCSGGDLKDFKRVATAGDKARDMAYATSIEVAQLFKKIRELPQLTVAVVEGGALAGGFGMACATDVLITTPDAKYALSEVKIGITPAQISPYVIERLGIANARRMMLLAQMINGAQAHELGMADFLAQDENEIETLLLSLQEQLNACAPGAVTSAKELLAHNQLLKGDEFIEYAANLFAGNMVSDEGKEGFNAFIEKRKPSWFADLDEEE